MVAITDRATIDSIALQLISEQGYHGASMRTIARRVGTSLSNLYNYYPSKAALVAHILGSGNEALLSAMRLVGRDAPVDTRESVSVVSNGQGSEVSGNPGVTRKIIAAASNYSLDNPVMMRVAITEARYLEGSFRKEVDEGQRKQVALLHDAIVRDPAVNHSIIDPYFIARSIMLLTANLPLWYGDTVQDARNQLIDKHLEACERLAAIR